jgi:hypothetical protein
VIQYITPAERALQRVRTNWRIVVPGVMLPGADAGSAFRTQSAEASRELRAKQKDK